MGFFGNIFGKIPLIGDVAKGVDQVLGRPGDLINHPDQFLGNAVKGALPFFMGPLANGLGTAVKMPAWANTLLGASGMMGGQGGQQRQPGTPDWLNAAMGAYGLSGLGRPRYLDSGMGDKALGYADKLGQAGTTMLDQSIGEFGQPQQGFPQLQNMGALGMMPGIMRQQAQNAGVRDPFDTSPEGEQQNPYALRAPEQMAYNQQAQMVNQGKQAALSNLRTQLAAKGINDPRAVAAAEAQINAGHNQMLTGTYSGLQNQAFQNRQNTLSQFGQQVPQLYGAQNQFRQQGRDDLFRRLGVGAGMMSTPLNAYENAAQRAIGTNQYNAGQQGQNLGMLLSPWTQQNPYTAWLQQLLGGQGGGQQGDQNAMPPWDLTGAVQGGGSATPPWMTPPWNEQMPGQNVGVPWEDYTPLGPDGQPDYLSQFNDMWSGFGG